MLLLWIGLGAQHVLHVHARAPQTTTAPAKVLGNRTDVAHCKHIIRDTCTRVLVPARFEGRRIVRDAAISFGAAISISPRGLRIPITEVALLLLLRAYVRPACSIVYVHIRLAIRVVRKEMSSQSAHRTLARYELFIYHDKPARALP